MAWDHSHSPSRQHHLHPVQGELLTGPFFHHTNRTHLLLENKTHPIRRVRNSHYLKMLQIRSCHFQRSGNTILWAIYERLSPVDVAVFSLPSKDICYQKFWCVVPVVAYFDGPARRVKIQTMSKYTQRYHTPKRLISYLLPNCFISWPFFKKWEKRRR